MFIFTLGDNKGNTLRRYRYILLYMFVCKQKTGNCTVSVTNNAHHTELIVMTQIEPQ